MKGQYFSFDAIIASVIFVLALMSLLSYWHSVRTYLDYQNNDIQREAIRISNLLFTEPSSPVCDDIPETGRLGLARAWDDRVVSRALLDCASSHDSLWVKTRLATPYNVSIVVEFLDDGSRQMIGGAGLPPDASEIVIMRRLATVEELDGATRLATFDLRLYR